MKSAAAAALFCSFVRSYIAANSAKSGDPVKSDRYLKGTPSVQVVGGEGLSGRKSEVRALPSSYPLSE